jgi:hypothetical protein
MGSREPDINAGSWFTAVTKDRMADDNLNVGDPDAAVLEVEETPDTPDEPTPEQIKNWRDGFEDQQKRAEKAEAELKKLRPDPETPAPKQGKDDDLAAARKDAREANERATRSELRSMGFTHPDDIKVVLDAAKELGIDPVEAAERRYVKADIEEQREKRRTLEATPAPKGGGGSSGSDTIARLADKVAKGGELPKDEATRFKVLDEIARRGKEGQ